MERERRLKQKQEKLVTLLIVPRKEDHLALFKQREGPSNE